MERARDVPGRARPLAGGRQTRVGWRSVPVGVGGIAVVALLVYVVGMYLSSNDHALRATQEEHAPGAAHMGSVQVENELHSGIDAHAAEAGMRRAIDVEPLLNEELLPPGLRFVPETYAQYLTSVYTWWNILDRVAAVTDSSRWIYGYMRKVQLLAYSQVVWGRTTLGNGQAAKKIIYCEVGLNAGHGTIAMLLANPRVHVYSFDMMMFPYSPTVVHLINSTFPGRFRVSRGDSLVKLPLHIKQVKANKAPWCDVALVDGDHSYEGSKQDLVNMAQIAKCNATLLADDINEGPGQALKEAEAMGLIELTEWNMYAQGAPQNPCVRTHIGKNVNRSPRFGDLRCMEWGWAMGRFVSNCPVA